MNARRGSSRRNYIPESFRSMYTLWLQWVHTKKKHGKKVHSNHHNFERERTKHLPRARLPAIWIYMDFAFYDYICWGFDYIYKSLYAWRPIWFGSLRTSINHRVYNALHVTREAIKYHTHTHALRWPSHKWLAAANAILIVERKEISSTRTAFEPHTNRHGH